MKKCDTRFQQAHIQCTAIYMYITRTGKILPVVPIASYLCVLIVFSTIPLKLRMYMHFRHVCN